MQSEIEHVFNNYWSVHNCKTGDVYYLKREDFDALRTKGILRYDEIPPSQWGFEDRDQESIEERIRE